MNGKSTFPMPEAASTLAKAVDPVMHFLIWLSIFFFALIVALMIYFVIRYRRRSEEDTTPTSRTTTCWRSSGA